MAARLGTPTDTCAFPRRVGLQECGRRKLSVGAVSVRTVRLSSTDPNREDRPRWHQAADPVAKSALRPSRGRRWSSIATIARCAVSPAATAWSACYSGYRKLCCTTNAPRWRCSPRPDWRLGYGWCRSAEIVDRVSPEWTWGRNPWTAVADVQPLTRK